MEVNLGNGSRNFGHLAYRADNIYETCQRLMDMGYTINRPPRKMDIWHLLDHQIKFQLKLLARRKFRTKRTMGYQWKILVLGKLYEKKEY